MSSDNHIRDYLLKTFGTTRLIVLSFVFVIVIGTFLLSLPFAQKHYISLLDNLFTATSATCVTGLLTLTLSDSYTLFGEIVVLCLIQIGGLGLMSIIAILITVTRHKLAYKEKTLIKDALSKIDVSDINRFLKNIFIFTIFFELCGAIIISFALIPEFGFLEGMYRSLFLSISAFCNAGIDNFGSNSLINFVTNPIINWTVMLLIITGGLGFTVWIDIYVNIKKKIREKYTFKKFYTKLMVHTKVVIWMTIFLLLSAFVLILFAESSNPFTLGTLTPFEKIQAAMFNATTLRTAGFSTVNYGSLMRGTLVIMLAYMFIGGSPGGTAGGIKTTTVFAIIYFLYCKIRGKEHMILMKREISIAQVNKSVLVFMYSFSLVFCGIIILSFTEPQLNFISIVFEVFSAFGTVGLSTGITGSLSAIGKIVIIILMFVGRVGAIALFMSLLGNMKGKRSPIEYPRAELLVG